MVLLYKAVEEGAIAKIDAGSVVGPKVLTVINSLQNRFKENDSKLEIFGTFEYNKIINSKNNRMPIPEDRVAGQAAYFCSEQEVKDSEKAVKDLKVIDCRKHFSRSYRKCFFHIKIGNGKSNLKYITPDF